MAKLRSVWRGVKIQFRRTAIDTSMGIASTLRGDLLKHDDAERSIRSVFSARHCRHGRDLALVTLKNRL
jgi:hypothetical protein